MANASWWQSDEKVNEIINKKFILTNLPDTYQSVWDKPSSGAKE